MRAVTVNKPGGFDALELIDVAEPSPAEGEVLIDVAFCGCNWADTQIRAGIYPHPMEYPIIMGFEASGTVLAVGEGVTGFKPGDRVCGMLPTGRGYAEQVTVDAAWLMHLPEAVSFETGAAFPIQALTAYHMLHTAYDLKAGETVLIHAAGGGVGLAAIQLVKLAGATPIGTVGTPGKEVKALDYGAVEVVNLNDAEQDFVASVMARTGGAGADLALDSLGGNALERTFDAVKFLGHIINYGEGEATPHNNIRERVMLRSQHFNRFTIFHVFPGTPAFERGNAYVLEALAAGRLEIQVVATFPLEQAGAMHQLLEGRSVSGKLLLSMQD